jgi:hypothetical protein
MNTFEPITICRQPDVLTQHRFEFIVLDGHLYLDRYHHFTRPTVRHRKWTCQNRYLRLSRFGDNTLTEAQVPLTPELRQEALALYLRQIKCLLWSERTR